MHAATIVLIILALLLALMMWEAFYGAWTSRITTSLAVRHLRTRGISYVAVALIAIVVVLYLLIISVLEGFKEHYMDKLQSIMAHTTVTVGQLAYGVQKPEKWAAEVAALDSGIKGVNIGLETPAMAVFDTARTVGTLRGVDLQNELKNGRLGEILNPKDIKEFGTYEQGGKPLPGCIVGGVWRRDYNLNIGGRVTFLFTDDDGEPRSQAFAIIGFFESKNPFLEESAYVDRRVLADKLKVSGMAKTLAIWLKDPNRPDLREFKKKLEAKVVELVARDCDDARLQKMVQVETWQEKNNNFYQAITRENIMMRFIMSIFLALIAFIIFLIFGRLVAEKVRDIGALRSMGATPQCIRSCFVLQGGFVGLFGLFFGLCGTAFILWRLNWFANWAGLDLFPGESLGAERIPIHVLPFDVLLISALTLMAALAGAYFPAWRASKLDPVECLRHE